jgi:hypothetical protein
VLYEELQGPFPFKLCCKSLALSHKRVGMLACVCQSMIYCLCSSADCWTEGSQCLNKPTIVLATPVGHSVKDAKGVSQWVRLS